jgi:glycosyltransferase involved in cell wall biosynthesis
VGRGIPYPAKGLAVESLVVIPTYNERPNIERLVGELFALPLDLHVLVVDDNSPDGTAEAVKALASKDARVRCLRRVGRRGLAGACIEGILSSSAPRRQSPICATLSRLTRLFDHGGQGEFRHQKSSLQVDVNLQIPFFLGAIQRGLGIENAGIVEKDVEAVERTYCLLDPAPAFVSLTNVSAQKDCFAAGFEYLRGYSMAALLIAAGHGDFGTLFREQDGGSFADAGGASGDESDFALQAHKFLKASRTT